MNNDRRRFLKLFGLSASGIVTSGLADSNALAAMTTNNPRFNMACYAARKLQTVRIGYIGLGDRGSEAVERIVHFAGIDIKAICDIRISQIDLALRHLKGTTFHPKTYHGDDEIWKKLCERDDIDLIYICTPWALHTPMACYAMNHGKHVAVEVPAAQTLEECWQLVDTSEKTKRHCVMMENECFDFFEMLTLNMARQGFLGEIIHTEGAYIHDISRSLFDRIRRPGLWRLNENCHRNGNLYPTHGLGPACQIMDINRGDKLTTVISMSTADFTLNDIAKEISSKDPSFSQYVDKPFRGNMNTSIIRTQKGKTIMLQHDISSTRPKSSRYLVSGTKAFAQMDAEAPKISTTHGKWLSAKEFKQLEEQFTFPFIRQVGTAARKIGGHGGMDVLMDWRMIDCLRHGLPLDYNVYDAAAWSALVPLSEWSVAHGSAPVEVPDFTRGSWANNKPIDMSIAHGTLTAIK
ncbi:MAG: Gfo/Idh/MocA family oxidoreductase [Chitinophagaceae bacterium]|nr:Gfo/Idh/MocA family oxidoreductase [Chitinophagaceae bacterium]